MNCNDNKERGAVGILPVPCAVLCGVFIMSPMQTSAHAVRLVISCFSSAGALARNGMLESIFRRGSPTPKNK